MKRIFTIVLVSFFVLIFSHMGWGQIAEFDFPATNSLVVSTSDANVTVSDMTLSSGTITTNVTTGAYFPNEPYIEETGGWTATDQTSAKYFTFTITASPGYTFSITNISFNAYATGLGPTAFSAEVDGTSISPVDAPSESLVSYSQSVSKTGLSSAVIKIQGWLNESRASTGSGIFRLDDVIISGVVSSSSGTPTKLAITSINNGYNPSANSSFDVLVQSQDNSNAVKNVSTNTDFSLSLGSGSGILSGTLTGTIPAGSNGVTISNVKYNTPESGVSITATRTSGDVLFAGTSSTFTVLDQASKLSFVDVPFGGQQGISLRSFKVEALRTDNSVDLNFTGDITIEKVSGSGNISGTLTETAVSGVATFNNIKFDASGTYTISTSATGLTGVTSGSINILPFQLPLVEDFDYAQGTTLVDNGYDPTTGTGTNDQTVGSTSLTYTGYPGSGVGNLVNLNNTGQDVFRRFDAVSSGSVYLSSMINVSNAKSGDYFLIMSQSSSAAQYVRVYVQNSGSGFVLGIAKFTDDATYSSTELTYGTTYICVVKYVFNIGSDTDDEISLFVFSEPTLPASEPGTPEIGPYSNTGIDDASDIAAFGLRQGSSGSAPTLTIDGIRVATSWAQAPLPVELTSFTAQLTNNKVMLKWQTATEVNNYGFDVERRLETGDWEKIGFVEGAGNSNSPKYYSFTDNPTSATSFSYRLKQIDVDGKYEYYDAITVKLNSKSAARLLQNSPNPFNPSTVIKFYIPNDSRVKIEIFDILGREVTTLVNEQKEAGYHVNYWNGNDKNGIAAASGVYLYRLTAGNYVETKKMNLLK